MIRNEMIALLADLLKQLPEDETLTSEEDVAIRILDKLELAGMAPPEVTEPTQTFVQDNMGRVFQTEDSKVFVRKWE